MNSCSVVFFPGRAIFDNPVHRLEKFFQNMNNSYSHNSEHEGDFFA